VAEETESLLQQLKQERPNAVDRRITTEMREKFGFQGKGYIHGDDRIQTHYLWDESVLETVGVCAWGMEVEGPPSYVHGGCIAAVMDEFFGITAFSSIAPQVAVTVNLNINYRKFVPLNSVKKIQAKIEKTEGRKIFVKGEIVDPSDGTSHVEGTAIFVIPRAPQ